MCCHAALTPCPAAGRARRRGYGRAHGQADGRGGEAVVAQDSPDLTALERAFGHRLALLEHHTSRPDEGNHQVDATPRRTVFGSERLYRSLQCGRKDEILVGVRYRQDSIKEAIV